MDYLLRPLTRLFLLFPLMASMFKEKSMISFFHGRSRNMNVSVPYFIFGDSLLDSGNNDYLNISAKINYWPYGETFFHFATGRFCDGRIPPDFIAENANLPFIKPYLDPNFSDYTDGANFASGGSGVLPDTTAGTLHLELQVSFFEEMTERLKQQKGDSDAQKLISRAVYHVGSGGNDYIVNAVDWLNANITIPLQDMEVLVSRVIGNLTASIKKLYQFGGRKFFFQNIAPIGCSPGSRMNNGTGGCWDEANILAEMHNEALWRLLARLEREMEGFKYGLFDYYTMLMERIINYSEFGFKVGESACCGSGAYNGKMTCGIEDDYFTLCNDPNEFVFFDSAHSTEATNRQLSSLMWNGSPPVVIGTANLKSLFQHL